MMVASLKLVLFPKQICWKYYSSLYMNFSDVNSLAFVNTAVFVTKLHYHIRHDYIKPAETAIYTACKSWYYLYNASECTY